MATLPQPNPEAEVMATVEHVRHLIMDRTLEDNPLTLDLAFSDAEINQAKGYALMMCNSIPPRVLTFQANNLPEQFQYPMLIATLYHLFLAKLSQLSRQNVDYSAGNMTADLTAKRIDYFTKWAGVFKAEATDSIKLLKQVINIENCYAHYY